eukprot:587900-Lingulodinium_polyedra.AAC.1
MLALTRPNILCRGVCRIPWPPANAPNMLCRVLCRVPRPPINTATTLLSASVGYCRGCIWLLVD